MNYSEERKSRKSIERISEILNEWDPIGVSEYVSDEYDMYINAIVLELDNGCDERTLSKLLKEIVVKRMCISSDEEANQRAAEQLIQHWKSYEVHSN